ncbi:NAD(P) transhydrogenase subunit alpha [Streptomyces sp. NRRL B-24085]|uniref:NAD(P) transhydrogenase subunit alpha n=1 Tax=Streptomyces sp. NRRL B-24085 TaxID=1709476 RepID=UPI0006B2F8BF|nr:NAD(P) transhydrogenase subunit alpha [Streptomyces sp. NRRL B-24085]
MHIGVPREVVPGETRVALTPDEVRALADEGHKVTVEHGAGDRAGHSDDAYLAAGAVPGTRADAFGADIVLQVHLAGAGGTVSADASGEDLALTRPSAVLVGLANPLSHPEPVRRLADHEVTAFSLDLLPRITRAQAMDVLSSQSAVAGYRAALIAADRLDKMLPMTTTAAGTLAPARVLVLGAGVVGLQAIATSRRLGAVVRAYDIRAAAREQVESVGGVFVDLPLDTSSAEGAGGYAQAQQEEFYARQREVLGNEVAAADIVIATAQVPGRPAPVLVTEEMVRAMRPGSVVVDAAAAQGGNCAVSVPDDTVVLAGVSVTAPTNLPAGAPAHASRLFARNIANFTRHLLDADGPRLDSDDAIIRDTLLTGAGRVVHPQVRELLGLEDAGAAEAGAPPAVNAVTAERS